MTPTPRTTRTLLAAGGLALCLAACSDTPASAATVVKPPSKTTTPATPGTPTPGTTVPATPTRQLPTLIGGDAPAGPLVVTHAGVGTPLVEADGAQKAADSAIAALLAGAPALDAAVVATGFLENDPRYNAGTGANIRLDGKTIQMDASLMNDEGKFAAVAAIERVKNPIRVARMVLDSPHVLLVGEGATRFAHKLGLPDEIPTSPQAEANYKTRMARLKQLIEAKGSKEPDWRDYWNFPGEMPADMAAWKHGGDTVGAVTRSHDNRFAATLSTGGTSVTLYGRVGDVPIYGAGLFAGPAGAVACTGHGEEIIRQSLARTVYLAIASGTPARDAVEHAAANFHPTWDVGLIAVDKHGWAAAATQEMATGHAPP